MVRRHNARGGGLVGNLGAVVRNVGGALVGRGANSAAGALGKRAGQALGKRIFKKRKAQPRSRGVSRDADDFHSGIARKSVSIKLHKKLKHKGLGQWKFSQNYSGILSGNSGNQTNSVIFTCCARNQFVTDQPTPNFLQIRQNLFDLNTDRVNTGSTLVPTQIKPATDRLAVYYVRQNLMLTNFESAACVVYLYWVTSKKDWPVFADVTWSNALAGESLTVANRTRAAGGTYGGTTAGAALATDVWQRPTDCRLFKDVYKVLKVMEVKLAGGATEEINVHIAINKLVKLQDITNQPHEIIKGLTVQMLAVAYAQPVHDTTVSATSNVVTTGSVEVGIVETAIYHCGLTAEAKATRLDDFYTNQQMPDNVLLAKQTMIGETDAVIPVAQA